MPVAVSQQPASPLLLPMAAVGIAYWSGAQENVGWLDRYSLSGLPNGSPIIWCAGLCVGVWTGGSHLCSRAASLTNSTPATRLDTRQGGCGYKPCGHCGPLPDVLPQLPGGQGECAGVSFSLVQPHPVAEAWLSSGRHGSRSVFATNTHPSLASSTACRPATCASSSATLSSRLAALPMLALLTACTLAALPSCTSAPLPCACQAGPEAGRPLRPCAPAHPRSSLCGASSAASPRKGPAMQQTWAATQAYMRIAAASLCWLQCRLTSQVPSTFFLWQARQGGCTPGGKQPGAGRGGCGQGRGPRGCHRPCGGHKGRLLVGSGEAIVLAAALYGGHVLLRCRRKDALHASPTCVCFSRAGWPSTPGMPTAPPQLGCSHFHVYRCREW